ncbi:hypothetical protein IFM89_036312 [Coptis chinensis]|uniref:Uncharacterized protein n=1 Tax=Coptis chinensis TaxID=261450 RepID=A0A835IGN6_9MAGN|nr:hypothetical protein IFM89_036312 [Coptis chinensis]
MDYIGRRVSYGQLSGKQGTVYGSLENHKLTFISSVKLIAGINKISLLSIDVGLPDIQVTLREEIKSAYVEQSTDAVKKDNNFLISSNPVQERDMVRENCQMHSSKQKHQVVKENKQHQPEFNPEPQGLGSIHRKLSSWFEKFVINLASAYNILLRKLVGAIVQF